MANYIVSYDLNGDVPTHDEMDNHISEAEWSSARILETVWYIGTEKNLDDVSKYINLILSKNDSMLIVRAKSARFRHLLVDKDDLKSAWKDNA